MRPFRTLTLVTALLFAAGAAHADYRRTARNVRATGITLTVMGMVQLTTLFALAGVVASPDVRSNDADLAAVVGMPITAVTGVTFLAAGIPLWVRGSLALHVRDEGAPPPRRTSPRGNRATGITLTVMGIVNAALIGAFIPAAVTTGGHDDFIANGIGYGGIGACAVLSSVFLSVGIPLWVKGARDLARQPAVAVAPNGLVAHF